MERAVYTIKEFEQYMNVGHATAYKLVHSPDFYPSFRIGRKILVNKDLLDKWINEQNISKPMELFQYNCEKK